MNTPLHILKTIFGYDAFRLNQEEIIQHVLNKKDAVVLMPTGGGKSLCYQVPALCMEGVTIVVSPLIALMKDQVDALTVSGIKAAFLNSTQNNSEQARVIQQLKNNELKLLYLAPERLMGNDSPVYPVSQTDKSFPACHRRGTLHLAMGARLPAGIFNIGPNETSNSRDTCDCLDGDS